MRGLVFFGLMAFYVPSSLALQCQDFFHLNHIEAPQERQLLFKRLEVFRRNNNLGPQQQSEQIFTRWIEMPPFQENIFNYIAITPDGRLFHVVDGMDRQVARLLSGHLKIEQFYIYKKSILVAVDANQRILFFNPQKWMKSPLGDLAQKGFMAWSAITTIATLGVYQFLPESVGPNALLLLSGATSVASAINTFLVMFSRYDRLNTYPDGFVDSALLFSWTGQMNRQLDSQAQAYWEQYTTTDHFLPPNNLSFSPQLPVKLSDGIRE